MPEVHVIPNGGYWACELDDAIRSTHDTKAEAIKRGCLVANQQACDLVIHAHDGTFREEGRPGIDFRGIPG